MFGRRKDEIVEDHKSPNTVIARVEFNKQGGGKAKQVKALVVRCTDGKTVYKAKYETTKSDIYAFHEASDELKHYIDREGLTLDSSITCNVPLPYVKTVKNKRMR